MHPPKLRRPRQARRGRHQGPFPKRPICRAWFVPSRRALTCTPWALSSVGRASPLQGEGRGIETRSAHVKAVELRRSRKGSLGPSTALGRLEPWPNTVLGLTPSSAEHSLRPSAHYLGVALVTADSYEPLVVPAVRTFLGLIDPGLIDPAGKVRGRTVPGLGPVPTANREAYKTGFVQTRFTQNGRRWPNPHLLQRRPTKQGARKLGCPQTHDRSGSRAALIRPRLATTTRPAPCQASHANAPSPSGETPMRAGRQQDSAPWWSSGAP
jgi:hypothetical protein